MNNRHSVKPADASRNVWNIHDASGRQIGACSSREDALRIAALADIRIAGLANSGSGIRGTQACGTSTIAESVNKEYNQAIVPRLQMFEWYSPRQSSSVWSLLKKCYDCARAAAHKITRRAIVTCSK